MPRFSSLKPYMKQGASLQETTEFIRREQGGAFTWDEIARYRDVWKGPLVLKGLLHPADAQRAIDMGIDGIVVSNHGGRQLNYAPAPVDMQPSVAEAVGGRVPLLVDGGISRGTGECLCAVQCSAVFGSGG